MPFTSVIPQSNLLDYTRLMCENTARYAINQMRSILLISRVDLHAETEFDDEKLL